MIVSPASKLAIKLSPSALNPFHTTRTSSERSENIAIKPNPQHPRCMYMYRTSRIHHRPPPADIHPPGIRRTSAFQDGIPIHVPPRTTLPASNCSFIQPSFPHGSNFDRPANTALSSPQLAMFLRTQTDLHTSRYPPVHPACGHLARRSKCTSVALHDNRGSAKLRQSQLPVTPASRVLAKT